jgi:hypothetical protein
MKITTTAEVELTPEHVYDYLSQCDAPLELVRCVSRSIQSLTPDGLSDLKRFIGDNAPPSTVRLIAFVEGEMKQAAKESTGTTT